MVKCNSCKDIKQELVLKLNEDLTEVSCEHCGIVYLRFKTNTNLLESIVTQVTGKKLKPKPKSK